MPEELICPVCDCVMDLSYGWLYSCNTKNCEMNGLILVVKNISEHKKEFNRVSRWIRTGRGIEKKWNEGMGDGLDKKGDAG